MPVVQVQHERAGAAGDGEPFVVAGGAAGGGYRADGAASELHGRRAVDVHRPSGVVEGGGNDERLQPRHPQHRGDEMAAGVHEHAAAGRCRIEPPAADAEPILRDVGGNALDLSQRALGDQLSGVDEVRHPMPLVGHHQHALALLRQGQQALGIGRFDDQGLFHQGVQTLFEAGPRLRVVDVVGRADEHRVGFGGFAALQHGAPIGEVGRFALWRVVARDPLHQQARIGFHRIGNGDDVRGAVGQEPWHVGVAHVAAGAHEQHGQSLLRHGSPSAPLQA